MNKKSAFIAVLGLAAVLGSALSAQAQGHGITLGVHFGYGTVYHGAGGFSPYYHGYYPYAGHYSYSHGIYGYQVYRSLPATVYNHVPYRYRTYGTHVQVYPSYRPAYGRYSPRRYHRPR